VTPADHLADDLLSALVDEELSPAELQAARSHLSTCVECSERLAPLRAIKDLLRRLPEVAPPGDFSLGPRVVADPPNVIRLQRWYTATRAVAASLAAVFVFLVAGTVYMDTAVAPARQRTAIEVTSSQGLTQNQVAAPTSLAAGAPARDAAQAPTKAQPPVAPQAPAAAPAPAPAGAQAPPAAATPAPAAPGLAARPQSAAAEAQSRAAAPPTPDSTDLTAAATRVQPLPTRPPVAAPTAAPFSAPAAASASLPLEDPAAPFRAAALTVGVLAVVVLLGALIVRHRLARARAPISPQE